MTLYNVNQLPVGDTREVSAMSIKRAFVIAVVIANLSCQSSSTSKEEAAPPAAEGGNWSGQMQNMATDVKKLLPFVYDRDAFQDPKNRQTISGYLKSFAQAAHHIKPETGKKFIGDDLLLNYSLASLTDDLNRASHSFDLGQLEYSRSVAKASLSHCFQCHSVTQAGSSATWDLDQLQSLNLAPLEKADLLVATRKYDKALTYMESLLNSPDFLKNYAFDFESLLRRYLALIIRVENAPRRASNALNKILDRGDTPHYIVEQAEGWRQSLKAWQKEKKQPVKNAKSMFDQVEKHFKKAEGIQHYEKDHAGDVEYLRATAQLHDGMKFLKSPADQAHALYLLGRAYEVLDELGSWNLHETYYEACIDRDPKTAIAKRCYSRLEASLYMGYSGSSGTHLPNEERERLKRLKEKLQ
jgi:hypothetical protein